MARVALRPVSAQLAAALLAGDLTGVRAGPGWPHDDTLIPLAGAVLPTKAGAGGWRVWLVVRPDTDEVIGECSTKGPAAATGAVEIGYALAPPARGSGLGREAVSALVAVLRTRRVPAVLANVHPTNEPSIRILERLGFAPVSVELDSSCYRLEVPPPMPTASRPSRDEPAMG